MKAWRLLMLPWMALSRGSRRVLAIVALIAIVLMLVGGVLSHKPGTAWLQDAIYGIAAFDCMAWAALMSQALLLAREAHQLRLPVLGREVNASLALYALLTIGLPALLLAWLGGNGAVALVELAMGAGLGLAYSTLPYFLGMWVCLIPMLGRNLGRWLPMPDTSPTGFLAWAAPGAAALGLLVALSWRRTVRRGGALEGMYKPIMLNLRTLAWYGRGGGTNIESRLIGQRARWLQPTADLRRSGPGHVLRSLRMALGGWSMPQTTASRLRQAGVLLAGLALVIVLSSGGRADVFAVFGDAGMLALYLGVAGPILAIVHAQTLRRRWRRDNAELPLLALLPGLGGAARLRHDLLRASLLPTLAVQLLALLATCGLIGWLRLDAGSSALLLLGQFAGIAMLTGFTLATLGGVALHEGALIVFIIADTFLTGVSAPLAVLGTHLLSRHPFATPILVVLWVCLLVPLLRLGLRGWRGLQRRPHPFLANV